MISHPNGAAASFPYVGLRSFESEDKVRFFGREREAEELFWTVIAYPQVLVYGRSGIGKTSLIRAGLTPLLEKEGHRVLPVARLREDSGPTDADNPSFFSALLGERFTPEPSDGAGASLPDVLGEEEQSLTVHTKKTLRVLVLDQLEEVFTWKTKPRQQFFHAIRQMLDKDLLLRAVFVLREDYLAAFETAVGVGRERWNVRFNLTGLQRAAAFSAVVEPARQYGIIWDSEAATHLVEQLDASEQTIEPSQLQIACTMLWQASGGKPISWFLLDSLGDVTGILAAYLDETIERAARMGSVGESALYTWLGEVLVTPAGTRSVALREQRRTAGMPNEVIDFLEASYLVRRELHAGSEWVELTHDLLVNALSLLKARRSE